MSRLENKVAIITGAGAGIGRGIALNFAREGAKVVVADRSQEGQETVKLITDAGGKAVFIQTDISQMDQVELMVKKAVDEFGALDILVNNAGIFPFKPFEEMAEADWDLVLGVNLKGTYFCISKALKLMKEGAKIVNISSIASVIGFAGLSHYCASKSGMNGLVRALALELAPKKININAIAPGAIDTPGANAISNEEIKKQTISQIPLARMGEPEDIANAALFLASDEASYITGQVLVVDGGWTVK